MGGFNKLRLFWKLKVFRKLKRFWNSFSGRMLLGILGIHLLLVPLLFISVFLIFERAFQTDFIDDVRKEAGLYKALIESNVRLDGSSENISSHLDEILLDEGIIFVDFLDQYGTVVLPELDMHESEFGFIEDLYFNEHNDKVYYIAVPVFNHTLGGIFGTLRLGFNEQPLIKIITLSYWRDAAIAIMYVVLSLLLAIFLGKRLSRPISRLGEVARSIASGEQLQDMRMETEILEIKHLARDLNVMRLSLGKSEKRFRNVFEYAAVGKALVTRDHEILEVNQAFCEILGYSEVELTNKSFIDIAHEDDTENVSQLLQKLFNEETKIINLETRYFHKEGHSIWTQLNASLIPGQEASDDHAIAQIQDISEAKILSERLFHQAHYDELTGLINRREFNYRLQRILQTSLQEKTDNALCYMDLDQFKVVNDTCGHIAGDELLKQIALLLQTHIRQRDTLARLGGDEFGVLMERCNLENAKRVAESLQKQVAGYQFQWEGKSFNIGVSIGLVPINSVSGSLTEILKHADSACYVAKDAGRNRVHVYHEKDEVSALRHGEMQWVGRIHQALEEDRFVLFYQEIVALGKDDNEGEHYELLLRMYDDENKIILPGAFLPAAERYNITPRLDHWVIKTVFEWFASNTQHVDQLHMCSINLSGLSLGDETLLDFIIHQFEKYPALARKICFEVTETAAINKLSSAISFIKILKGYGCKFSLDDFGSGLSSFAYLKNLPVDFLKIDGLFVKDMLNDPLDFALVRSINEIGHVMGKKTIAEFVENREIFDKLSEIGVDFAQGYWSGHPAPLSDLELKPEPVGLS